MSNLNITKKDKLIVMGATGNITFAPANVLLGIKKHSPDLNSNFLIFHNNISEKDQELMNSIIPCKFIEYQMPIDTSGVEKSSFERYTKLSFSRYECFNLLKEYKNIIWLDIDILIQKDISGLFQLCDKGIGLFKEEAPLQECFSKPIDNYNMFASHYNSGVISLSDELINYDKMADWLYKKTYELADYLYYADQGIINLLIQEFDLDVTDIGENYNYHPTKPSTNKAVIVHSYSPEKFWLYYNSKYHFNEWDKNYRQWIKLGGSPYTGYVPKPSERFMRTHFPGVPNPIRQTGNLLNIW